MHAERLNRLYGRRAGRVTAAAPGDTPAAFASQTDAAITAIAADGWRVVYDTPPTEMDPIGDPKRLTVQRAGFAGVATPITSGGEHIVLMKRERQLFPNHASLTADSVTLARHVYAGDKLYSSAGVLEGLANNSTLAAPKPVWACLNHPLECVRTTLHTIRIVAAHAHGRNGKPVAGVRLRMSDGSTTVDYDQTELTDYTLPNGVHVACYEFEVDFSDFVTGAYVTADSIIYPWVGAVYQASVDGYAYPAAHATVVKFWNDHLASEPRAHAFVGPAGNDGTGVAGASEAAARANPFATYGAAMTAAMAQTTGGTAAQEVILTVLAGTMDLDTSQTSRSASNYAMTIRRDPLDVQANCKISQTTSGNGRLMDKHIVSGLTVVTSGQTIEFTSSAGDTAYLHGLSVWKDCDFDATGGAPTYFAYHNGVRWFENCTGDNVNQALLFTTTFFHAVCVVGGSFAENSTNQLFYTVVGWDPMSEGNGDSKIGGLRSTSVLSNMTPQDGRFVGWCGISQGDDTKPHITMGQEDEPMGVRGAAAVMNICEGHGTHAGHGISSFADNVDEDCQGLVIAHNTVVGDAANGASRCNSFYGRAADPPSRKVGAVIGNLFEQYNMKADVYESDADAVQGIENRYAVDAYGFVLLSGDGNNDVATYGPEEWKGEVQPLYSISGRQSVRLDPGFADDQSRAVGGAGGGDYTPSGTALDAAAMPAALAHYPFDRSGRPLVDGWLPGALQKAA